jgi:hypothetical protein
VPPDAVGPIRLKPTQQRVVAALTADGAPELTRAQYEKLAEVSRSQAAYDLAELVEAGILQRVGKGRATRYRLAQESGSQRRWTEERIRSELSEFCAGRETWPSARTFKEAGRGDLYIAASRYGGIAHWAETLGFPREPRADRSEPQPEPAPTRAARPRSPLRTRLAWAGAGAFVALGLAAAAAVVTLTLTRDSTPIANQAHESPRAAPPARVSDESVHATPHLLAAKKAPATRRRVTTTRRTTTRRGATRRVVRPQARTRRTTPAAATYVSSAPSTAAPSGETTRTWSAGTSSRTSSAGPSPLPAPPGGSAPEPLKAR